jgi:hypothetical protein
MYVCFIGKRGTVAGFRPLPGDADHTAGEVRMNPHEVRHEVAFAIWGQFRPEFDPAADLQG